MPLCTLADVKLRLWPGEVTATTDYDTELNEYISQVDDDIQEYTGRQFLGDSIDTAYLFDIEPLRTRAIVVTRGIQSITTLSFAASSQPSSGGVFSTITAANYVLRPLPQDRQPGGWPADTIILSDNPANQTFWRGFNTVSLLGKLGWASVPPEINAIAISAVVARFQARGGQQEQAMGGPMLGGSIFPFITYNEKKRLDDYRAPRVG